MTGFTLESRYLTFGVRTSEDDQAKILAQLCDYKAGRGHFSRVECRAMENQPLHFWKHVQKPSARITKFGIKSIFTKHICSTF